MAEREEEEKHELHRCVANGGAFVRAKERERGGKKKKGYKFASDGLSKSLLLIDLIRNETIAKDKRPADESAYMMNIPSCMRVCR